MTRLNFLFRSWGWIGNNQIFCMFFHESYRFKASWGDDKYGFIVGCGEFSGVRWVEWRVRWLDCLTSSWLITKVKYTCPRPGVMDWYPHWYTRVQIPHTRNILRFPRTYMIVWLACLGSAWRMQEDRWASVTNTRMISLLPSRKQHSNWMSMIPICRCLRVSNPGVK